jgi:uncharacterized protein YndB with AHSA1/START domain
MSTTNIPAFDQELDLILDRAIDVPRDQVWKALVEPELVKRWFAPAPWKTIDCKIDLRPGGMFHFVMQGPEGEKHGGTGCYLEIVPKERVIWTAALQPGFRPAPPAPADDKTCNALTFTCIITLEAKGDSTRYTAHVLHASPQHRKMHEEMGFHEGWGICLDQMVEVAKGL